MMNYNPRVIAIVTMPPAPRRLHASFPLSVMMLYLRMIQAVYRQHKESAPACLHNYCRLPHERQMKEGSLNNC